MKKVYEKPMISVEDLALDMPIAENCNADYEDLQMLIDWGYFGPNDRGITCQMVHEDGHDTICYHSNVQKAFLS